MSYIFERRRVEIFEVERVKRNFMKYGVFSIVRKDKPDCEFCSKKFKGADTTNLAFVKDKLNHLICDNCAHEAISGGAEEIDWGTDR